MVLAWGFEVAESKGVIVGVPRRCPVRVPILVPEAVREEGYHIIFTAQGADNGDTEVITASGLRFGYGKVSGCSDDRAERGSKSVQFSTVARGQLTTVVASPSPSRALIVGCIGIYRHLGESYGGPCAAEVV